MQPGRSVLKGSLENIVVKQEPAALNGYPIEHATALNQPGFQAIAKWESDCKVFDLVEQATRAAEITSFEFKEEPPFNEAFASPAPSNSEIHSAHPDSGHPDGGLLDGILDLEDLEESLSGSSDLFPDIGNFVAAPSNGRQFNSQVSMTSQNSMTSQSTLPDSLSSSVFQDGAEIDTLFSGLDTLPFEDANAMETWIKTH